MKHKLLYFFLSMTILAAGCIKSTPKSQPAPTPSGTFSGKYQRFHRHTGIGPWDTIKTNLSIKFSTTDYTYAITGATPTVHANSYGAFVMNSPYIGFTDQTISASDTSKVAHLAGYYLYNYDGTNLVLYATSADTLVIGYSLTKTAN